MKCFVNKGSMHTLCYVDIVGSGEFFPSRLQCKCSRGIFFSILCSHKCGFIYTRFHAYMLTSSMIFCVVEENRYLK